MKITQKLCAQGEMLPPWYGVAWYEFSRDVAVCYPVPFNRMAAFGRALWLWLRHGSREVRLNPRDAYYQGLKQGRLEIRQALGDSSKTDASGINHG